MRCINDFLELIGTVPDLCPSLVHRDREFAGVRGCMSSINLTSGIATEPTDLGVSQRGRREQETDRCEHRGQRCDGDELTHLKPPLCQLLELRMRATESCQWSTLS